MKSLITYFYHINDSRDSSKWFHHRFFLTVGNKFSFNLEIASGFSFRLQFQRGEAGDDQNDCCLSIGFILGTLYFTFPFPKKWLEQKKCIATWDNNREFYLVQGRNYGFYIYDWAFVWDWHAKVHESSSLDPWWMRQYVHLDELVLGKTEFIERELLVSENVQFLIGDKKYKIDKIRWSRRQYFRRFLPFALYHKTHYLVDMEINDPPMFAGKGENSWDCGDDGTFGGSYSWSGPVPNWNNKEDCTKLAVDYYIENIFKNVKRYGPASKNNERRFLSTDKYEFIGTQLSYEEGVSGTQ